ncbi:sugar transferase, PEP-CTERM system associated/exopolysaccharide biosynthesis polyprenyl glycosylphosphotransferase [Arsukibacterium tuosuense]|uniref:Sugar transferase, PEP-CTERM system associated/exopolysaccharide biosynthesis polyprenyl glycosylphosphotransferase n=1 Tax=Arsukibacterium tuosuense TaxID=1323745 RepID=A0A285IU72_9GAMM|nr:TIGR03013 family XrtA/PEP-CTERM system glycosyltransferase [Arsukibacterium tuosuense]SNY51580.1 sugar transferase, PEP-CTERM system associated/exopolysaccharide biosynthesis polyprenyl glycosylphosphotransferase [Arsukibacterium tuosuense]
MGTYRRHGKSTIADKLFLISEVSLLCLSSLVASYLYNNLNPHISLDYRLINAALFAATVMLCALSVGLYDQKLRESHGGIIKRVVITLLFSALLLEGVIFNLFPFLHISTLYLAVASVIALFSLTAFRAFFHYNDITRISRRRILVLGAGERASIIERRMRRNVDKRFFEIVGFAHIDGDRSASIPEEKLITFDYKENLFQYVIDNGIDQLVIACDERRNMLPVEHLFKCKSRGIEVIEILDFIERETGQIAVNLIYPSWIIYGNGLDLNQRFKTNLDYKLNLVLAVLLLAVTWPIMLLTALLIYLEDGRKTGASVFYRQVRVGFDGKPFYILKFRSMKPDAEKNGARWASADDDRVTRVGKYIRKYRIDELPQLMNVLKGEMGFVGPRPERPEFVNELVKDIPYYSQRHNVKPGLTGWAQLKYPYGATAEDAQEKLKFDLYYIKHRSLLLDLMILIRTVEIVLFGKGR